MSGREVFLTVLCVTAVLLFPLEFVGAVVAMAFQVPIACPPLAFIGLAVLSTCSVISSVGFRERLGGLRSAVVVPVFTCAVVAGEPFAYSFFG